MMSQLSELSDRLTSVLITQSEIYDDTFYYLSELYSPNEKRYYHQQKEKLEIEVDSLKNQVSELEKKHTQKQQYVPKGELFEIKYQVIDSFYNQNIQSYIDMIDLFDQIQTENIKLQRQIIFYEQKIEEQFEIRKSIINERDQLQSLLDFTSFPKIDFPSLTNVQGQNFTNLNFIEFDNDTESSNDSSNSSDSSIHNKKHKKPIDFYIQNAHMHIAWSENRLNGLKSEINKFDILLDTYNESQKRNAANTISTAQQALSKKSQISSQTLKITIEDLQKLWEDSEKAVKQLEHQNEELRQKKVKNDLNFSNEKAKLKMLRFASIECYKKELSEKKNKIKHLRRLINSKADEYDFNNESLLQVFNHFDEKINDQSGKVKDLWKPKESTNDIAVEEEEEESEDNINEEEVIKIPFNDTSLPILLNELEKKKNELENDIKILKKQLKKMVLIYNNKTFTLSSKIDQLKNKDKRFQLMIRNELENMKKLPQKNSCKYFDKIDASMMKLNQLLENS